MRTLGRVGVALCLLSPSVAPSLTTVVAIWTPDQIVVAADSKVIVEDASGKKGSTLYCKVVDAGDGLFVSAAGYAWSTFTGYNIFESAVRGFRRDRNAAPTGIFFSAVEMFDEIATAFGEAVKQRRIRFPEGDSVQSFEAMVVFFEEGVPKVRSWSGRPVGEEGIMIGDGKSIPEAFALVKSPPPVWLIVLGYKREIAKYVATNQGWWQQDLVEVSRRFVQMEIDAHPEMVGPPIDILVLSRQGTRWAQRKSLCDTSTQ